MAFVINISSFKHDFLRQSYFLNQFEHLISYWSGFSWRSLEILRMLPCSDKFLASSPAPRLYWQWMFARRCCPRRACYTLRKSRRFITWQIYCLPCLSLPSRNLSEWGSSVHPVAAGHCSFVPFKNLWKRRQHLIFLMTLLMFAAN